MQINFKINNLLILIKILINFKINNSLILFKIIINFKINNSLILFKIIINFKIFLNKIFKELYPTNNLRNNWPLVIMIKKYKKI
jgi:hypothetical protein